MARTESRTKTSIWSEDDFRALTSRAQRMYWLLYSQPTINLCGVLALTERRWASTASDESLETVSLALKELEDASYILVDRETEEVFVRTFARHDGVARTQKTFEPAWRQLPSIASRTIREAARQALSELGPEPNNTVSPASGIPNGIPYSDVENQSSDTSGVRARAPSSLRLPPPSPSSCLPAQAPKETVAQRQETKPPAERVLELTKAVARICKGKDRPFVNTEAGALVVWALSAVDPRAVEESIGWATAQVTPPDLPRALASTIAKKARDKGITLMPFDPPRSKK